MTKEQSAILDVFKATDKPSGRQAAYTIRHEAPEIPPGVFCQEALKEHIQQVVTACQPFEDAWIIEALIQKGALMPET